MSAAASAGQRLRLRLYVAGAAPNSLAARRNLRAIRGDDWDIEILDVFEATADAEADGILVTPTLLRLGPGPPLRIVGSLSDHDDVRFVLTAAEEAP